MSVFEIRENNHCGGVIFQAGKPESMLKSSTSTVIISSYFEHWMFHGCMWFVQSLFTSLNFSSETYILNSSYQWS